MNLNEIIIPGMTQAELYAPLPEPDATRIMALSWLILDSRCQPRAELNQETILRYAEALEGGATFPAIEVVDAGDGNRWVVDGWHRYHAHKIAGLDEILVHVRKGSLKEARWIALAANATHGLARTRADLWRAIDLALEDPEWAALSDRKLSEYLQCSPKTIAAGRRRRLPTPPLEECEDDLIQLSVIIDTTTTIGPYQLTRLTLDGEVLEELLVTMDSVDYAFTLADDGYIFERSDEQPMNRDLAVTTLNHISRLAKGELEQVVINALKIASSRIEGYERSRVVASTKKAPRTSELERCPHTIDLTETLQAESNELDSNEWYTPDLLLALVKLVMRSIDLDPASCVEAQRVVKAGHYLTKADDGLECDWGALTPRTVWLNPPYARGIIDRFALKFIKEWEAGAFEEGMILTNASVCSTWWQQLARRADAVAFPSARVPFWRPGTPSSASSAFHDQSLFYFGQNIMDFRDVFGGASWLVTITLDALDVRLERAQGELLR